MYWLIWLEVKVPKAVPSFMAKLIWYTLVPCCWLTLNWLASRSLPVKAGQGVGQPGDAGLLDVYWFGSNVSPTLSGVVPVIQNLSTPDFNRVLIVSSSLPLKWGRSTSMP